MNIRIRFLSIFSKTICSLIFGLIFDLTLCFQNSASYAQDLNTASTQAWEKWIQSRESQDTPTVVQDRQVVKENRFQILGSFLGTADRNDLYHHYLISLSGRYHFSESHAWEFSRFYLNFPFSSNINKEVISKTEYSPDIQLSRFQWVSSYVWTPIYGKYAWNGKSTVYFDIFVTAGVGFRFAKDLQPVFETGIGMNHFLWMKRFSIIPEYRLRVYSEQRTETTTVLENLFQLSTAWLF